MAEVVAVIASTHHPFYLRASTATGDARPPFADEWDSPEMSAYDNYDANRQQLETR